MNIALVLHPFGENESSGLGRMALSLSHALIKSAQEHHFIIFTKGECPKQKTFAESNWEAHAGSGGFLWLDRLLFKGPKADVYIFFTPMMPLFFHPRGAIVFVHDFAHFYQDSKTPLLKKNILKLLYRHAIKKASAVIAVSKYTKGEVCRIFQTPREKVFVVYNGTNEICSVAPQEVGGITGPFFLFVGAVKDRKNILNILCGFAEFVSRTQFGGMLVIAGKKGGAYSDRVDKVISDLGIASQVLITGFISDGELSFLYQNALALVSPTRVEGFGMTAVEAMVCGTPVIVSKIGALEEVVDDAGLFVDPESPQEIAQAMEHISTNSTLRDDLVQKGRKRALVFSWDKAARELKSIINKVCL